MPQKNFEVEAGSDNERETGHEKNNTIRGKMVTTEEELIYDAKDRGGCYHCIRVLWCGCCEPYAHITTKYVKEDRWEGCSKKSDSMAFENILDVRRQQTCCCLMASFAPCCPCVVDMGDIVLFGSDASEQKKTGHPNPAKQIDPKVEPEKWVLKRISNSFDTFEKITGHLQDIHAGWRTFGRTLQRKVQQINH